MRHLGHTSKTRAASTSLAGLLAQVLARAHRPVSGIRELDSMQVGRSRLRVGAWSRVGVGCLSMVQSVATRAGQGQRTSRTLPGVCNFDWQTTRSDPMPTDVSNMGCDKRRARLEQRRAVVARELRRLAIELRDIDRQLDEIEQSQC